MRKRRNPVRTEVDQDLPKKVPRVNPTKLHNLGLPAYMKIVINFMAVRMLLISIWERNMQKNEIFLVYVQNTKIRKGMEEFLIWMTNVQYADPCKNVEKRNDFKYL